MDDDDGFLADAIAEALNVESESGEGGSDEFLGTLVKLVGIVNMRFQRHEKASENIHNIARDSVAQATHQGLCQVFAHKSAPPYYGLAWHLAS